MANGFMTDQTAYCLTSQMLSEELEEIFHARDL